MFIYYVYAYLREDGSPYYIGKGSKKRAFNTNHRVNLPTNPDRIVFLERNLSEIGALALERFYIRWYGRVDINTGILRNLTDGGETAAGRVPWNKGLKRPGSRKPHSDATKEKMRLAKLGKERSAEVKAKISQSKLGRSPLKKRGPHSEETRRKISLTLANRKTHDRQSSHVTCLS